MLGYVQEVLMKTDLYIHSFLSILPEHHLPQSQIVDWTLKSHIAVESFKGEGDGEKFSRHLARFCLNENYITQRYFECNEVDENWEQHRIYKITPNNPMGATIEERNIFFGEKAKVVFEKMYHDQVPEHIVHVTCTGYISPSPAQVYFSGKEKSPAITHAYHMGCYASLPAVRMAVGLSMSEERTIDVVHTEMCSLHLRPEVHTPEQMVVQTLFADGHIKYSIGQERKGMKVLSVHEKLVPESLNDMTWIPASHGMSMTLSREVPFKIRDMLPDFISELCLKSNVNRDEILKDGIFAIHPGGPKIIEAVQKKLELASDQVKESQKILSARGNMSSATLPHVWDEILKSHPRAGTKVLSLAFGPGLTIFGAIFEVV
jgi:predicted naringenin-chalcone synthase